MKNLNYKILMLFFVIISFENFFCMNQQNKGNLDLEITEKNEAINKFNKELKERSKLGLKKLSSILYKFFISEKIQFTNEKNAVNKIFAKSTKDLNHIKYKESHTSNTLKLIVATAFMTYGISKLLKTNYDLGIKYSDFTKYKNGSLFSLRSNLRSIFNLYNNGQIDASDCYKMILACNTFSVPLFLSSMLLLRSSNNAISNFLIKSIESDTDEYTDRKILNKNKEKSKNKMKNILIMDSILILGSISYLFLGNKINFWRNKIDKLMLPVKNAIMNNKLTTSFGLPVKSAIMNNKLTTSFGLTAACLIFKNIKQSKKNEELVEENNVLNKNKLTYEDQDYIKNKTAKDQIIKLSNEFAIYEIANGFVKNIKTKLEEECNKLLKLNNNKLVKVKDKMLRIKNDFEENVKEKKMNNKILTLSNINDQCTIINQLNVNYCNGYDYLIKEEQKVNKEKNTLMQNYKYSLNQLEMMNDYTEQTINEKQFENDLKLYFIYKKIINLINEIDDSKDSFLLIKENYNKLIMMFKPKLLINNEKINNNNDDYYNQVENCSIILEQFKKKIESIFMDINKDLENKINKYYEELEKQQKINNDFNVNNANNNQVQLENH